MMEDPLRGRRGQEGFGLVEVLATIVIMATVLTALLLLVTTLLDSGGSQRAKTEATNFALNAAESIDSMKYKKCSSGDDSGAFQASFGIDDDDYWDVSLESTASTQVSVEKVEFLENADPSISEAAFVSTCPVSDQGVQRITVHVSTSRFGGGEASVEVLKRNTDCDPNLVNEVNASIPPGQNGLVEC
jgi:type II secretory pathway pseudopilin PulG